MTLRSPRRHPARVAMTLIELLVAMALGTILIGVVAFIWMQSQKIFSSTINRLETYQRLRTILDVLERDLANTTRSVDMEFFVDSDPPGPEEPNGHYEIGADRIMEVDGVEFRKPRGDQDPLAGTGPPVGFTVPGEEFGITGFPPLPSPTASEAYLYGGVVLSPPPYMINAGYTDNRAYWRDEIYVRSFAMVDGENRAALVHYRLVQTADGRSSLRRRIWYLDSNYEITTETDRTTILAHGIADLKVAFFFKENTSQQVGSTTGVGRWYHLGNVENDWSAEGKALRDVDEIRGIVSARGAEALSPQHVDQFKDQDGNLMNAISFVYKGNARFEDQETGGVAFRSLADGALDSLAAGSSAAYSDPPFNFPGVRPGDKLYVYNATDDDSSQTSGAAREAGVNFPDKIFTVETISSDEDEDHTVVKFREQINFFRLGYSWLGNEDSSITLSAHDAAGGPARAVKRSFNVQYRVGFLPAAFLIRLSCDDPLNRRILAFERVIRLLQQ